MGASHRLESKWASQPVRLGMEGVREAHNINSQSRPPFVPGLFGKHQVLKFESVVYEVSGYKSSYDAVVA